MKRIFISRSKLWSTRIELILLLMTMSVLTLNAQDDSSDPYSKADRFVASLVKSTGADARCDVFTQLNIDDLEKSEIEKLIRNGRYIKSITFTKSGYLVVSESNVENIQQMCITIPYYCFKKEVNKEFKKGWALTYYNSEQGFAIFDKNPAITKQVYTEIKTWKEDVNKKIAKWNAKGFYVTIVRGVCNLILQKGRGENTEQCYALYICSKDDEVFIEGIQKYKDEGWIVSSSAKGYNEFGNFDDYRVIFDKTSKEKAQNQDILLLGTSGGEDSLRAKIEDGYRIARIWGGWEGRDYAAERTARAERAAKRAASSEKTDWLGIIGGIVGGVSELAGGNSSRGVSNYGASSSSDTENIYNKSSGNGFGGNSSSSKNGDSSKANHANWQSLEKSYSGYESTLIRMSNSSDIDKQEVRRIQNKMREIREKIRVQSGGHQRAVSQWENWNP